MKKTIVMEQMQVSIEIEGNGRTVSSNFRKSNFGIWWKKICC